MVSLVNYIRWLSLDIALGGAILLSFVVRDIYHLPLPGPVLLALVLSILLVYTADHLLDARRIGQPAMPRHRFHKRYANQIGVYLITLLFSGMVVMWYLPPGILHLGVGIGGACLFYLLVNRMLAGLGLKEVMVALVYAMVMFMIPWLELNFGWQDWVMLTQLFFLALANLMVIAVYEHQPDLMDKTFSIAHFLSVRQTMRLTYTLLFINFAGVAVFGWVAGFTQYQLFVLLASLVLLSVLCFRGFFAHRERYRWASDWVFFIPVLL